MASPAVSVVIPTRNRAGYLEVSLASLADQDLDAPYEVVVVDDASDDVTPAAAAAAGARLVRHPAPRGANAARNSGVRAAAGDLVALIDDDVEVPRGWLRALVEGAARHSEAEAFGGPIRARFDGPAPRSCGRERPPITTLDLGPRDRPADVVWSANMLVRRRAFARVGPFDETLPTGGDEEEWLLRLGAAGGKVVYLADALLVHRRAGEDARLRALARSAYHRGRHTRAYEDRMGRAPGLGRELRVLAGCGWHTVRRACPQGVVSGAAAAGRTLEALASGDGGRPLGASPPETARGVFVAGRPEDPGSIGEGTVEAGTLPDPAGTLPDPGGTLPDPATFLSGERGAVLGRRMRLRRRAEDRALDLLAALRGTPAMLDALAREAPGRQVLILGVYRPGGARAAAAVRELRESRHGVELALVSTSTAAPDLAAQTVATGCGGGKFENLNTGLAAAGAREADWTLVVDDDVVLPARFLDRFVGLCEAFDLGLAQPAQTRTSHAAWRVVRRRPASVLRETRFVEIGPVTAFRREVAAELLPFPPLRFGWGLDLHWAAVAARQGWRLGVADAVAIRHEDQPVGAAYPWLEAVEEAQRFLATRPYLDSRRAQETLRVHRRPPPG